MTAAIIIPIAIWQARRDRREKLKAEQSLIEQIETMSEEEFAKFAKAYQDYPNPPREWEGFR